MPTQKKRGAAREGGGLKRGLRLIVLMAMMGLIGFFAVLVVDVSSSLVGRIHLGDTTLAGLWDKVVDRVLDRDVPRLPEAARQPTTRARPKAAPAPSATPRSGAGVERAPMPAAPLPEEDARHVDRTPRPDPQVEQAKKRLDDLLKRL